MNLDQKRKILDELESKLILERFPSDKWFVLLGAFLGMRTSRCTEVQGLGSYYVYPYTYPHKDSSEYLRLPLRAWQVHDFAERFLSESGAKNPIRYATFEIRRRTKCSREKNILGLGLQRTSVCEIEIFDAKHGCALTFDGECGADTIRENDFIYPYTPNEACECIALMRAFTRVLRRSVRLESDEILVQAA